MAFGTLANFCNPTIMAPSISKVVNHRKSCVTDKATGRFMPDGITNGSRAGFLRCVNSIIHTKSESKVFGVTSLQQSGAVT